MASTVQRRRQLARQRWEKQQARRAAAAARVRRRRKVLAVLAVAVVVVGAVAASLLVWPRWLSDDTTTAGPEDPPPGECFYAATGVADVDLGLPPSAPVAATTATLTLDGQPVTVELLSDAAPCTVSSLIHLAGNDYFDGTSCHRLTTSATLRVLQCGDPAGDGTGGPGYEFSTENTAGATYPAGTVAMARGDDPDSNGSQFFLVYEDSELPPDFTVFGQITAGLEVVAGIAQRGTVDGVEDGPPAQPVTLDDLVTAA